LQCRRPSLYDHMFNSMIDTLMLRSKWSFATVYMPRHAATGIRDVPFSRFGEQDQSSHGRSQRIGGAEAQLRGRTARSITLTVRQTRLAHIDFPRLAEQSRSCERCRLLSRFATSSEVQACTNEHSGFYASWI
jgi:hypothetical protein